jgi:hypothetical protein
MKSPYFSCPLNVDPKAKTASLMDDISADLKGAAEWDVFFFLNIFFFLAKNWGIFVTKIGRSWGNGTFAI